MRTGGEANSDADAECSPCADEGAAREPSAAKQRKHEVALGERAPVQQDLSEARRLLQLEMGVQGHSRMSLELAWLLKGH